MEPAIENYIRMGNTADEPDCHWLWERAGVEVGRFRTLLTGRSFAKEALRKGYARILQSRPAPSIQRASTSRLRALQRGSSCLARRFPRSLQAWPGSREERSCGRRKGLVRPCAAPTFARDWSDIQSQLGSPEC